MNRLKLWLFILVVLVVGLVNVVLVTREGAALALRDVDASLEQGAAAHRARERLEGSRVSALAALAGRDEALLASLAPDQPAEGKKKGKAPEPMSPAELEARHEAEMASAGPAVKRAAEALGLELPPAAFFMVGRAAWVEAQPKERHQAEALAFLADAGAGKVRAGYARVQDGVWYGVARPAGVGAGIAIFFPVDSAWVAALKQESGCDVTISAGAPQLVTTLSPEQGKAAASSGATPGQAVGQGLLGRLQVTTPIRMQAPLLFTSPPASRSLAVGLTGLPRGSAILSLPTAKAFGSLVHYQWVSFEVLAGLVLIGLLFGLLLRTEVLPQVPAELVAAATKIERGDFTARAPTFAGALGTISGALNRASEAVQAARSAALKAELGAPLSMPPAEAPEPQFDFTSRAAPSTEPPSRPQDPFGLGLPTAGSPADPFATPPAATPAPAPSAASSVLFPTAPGAGVPPAVASAPPPAPSPAPSRPAPSPTSAGLTQVVFPSVTAPTAAPGPEEDEDAHWRAIHAEFLETRVRCGESIENLGFERFRPKLQKNKEALLQKYGCRAVRFSVYVKEGKAALKATPVR